MNEGWYSVVLTVMSVTDEDEILNLVMLINNRGLAANE